MNASIIFSFIITIYNNQKKYQRYSNLSKHFCEVFRNFFFFFFCSIGVFLFCFLSLSTFCLYELYFELHLMQIFIVLFFHFINHFHVNFMIFFLWFLWYFRLLFYFIFGLKGNSIVTFLIILSDKAQFLFWW